MHNRFKATFIGCIAILLWGCLALLTDLNRLLPPFQLMTMSFSVGFLVIAIKWRICGQSALVLLKQPVGNWVLSLFGLFGYHFFYFLALQHAPALQASLIAYLWPLLIVVLAPLVIGQSLKPMLMFGVALSVAGCWLLIWQPGSQIDTEHLWGYIYAFVCALIWSLYSVLSRKRQQVPSDFIGWSCGVTAVLALICHLLMEQTIWPLTSEQWLGVLLLGAGPVGLAFLAWDFGVKKGHLTLLGSLSYLTPLLSTCLLVVFGNALLTGQIIFGGLLILSGAFISTKTFDNKKQATQPF